MNEKELLIAFAGKALNLPESEAKALMFEDKDGAEVLKSDALNAILEKDRIRIQKKDDDAKTKADNFYKKGQAETMSKFEKQIREHFSVESDKQGVELIEEVLSTKSTAKPGEIDEQAVKKHPVYLSAIDKLKKEKEAVENEWKGKYEGRENELKRKAINETIRKEALKYIESLNPVLPSDPKKADYQKNKLVDEILSEFEFEFKDGSDKPLILKREGDKSKVYEDGHGHPVTFEALIKGKSENFWDFKHGQGRKGTGNNNDDGGSDTGGKYTGPAPKNESEYVDFISKAKSEEEKIEITDMWRAERMKNN